MLVNVATSFIGIIVFLFIFWKRLREDYASGIIFETAFYILFGIGLVQLVSFKLFPDWFFWTGLMGAIAGLYLGILRFRLRFYESLEAVVISLLPWLGFVFLKDSVINSSLSSFLVFLSTLVFAFIFYYVDTHFREFTWYKSGRVGFAGLATTALIFVGRAAIALLRINVLTFPSRYESILSGTVGFICFVLIYRLSKKVQ